MKLHITGSPKNTKKSSVRYAANFFANQLFSKRLNRLITVNLSFSCEGLNPKDWGSCIYLDKPGYPRRFEMFIRPTLKKADIYETLAHEMRHVYQYAKNQLYEYSFKEDRTRWKRKIYKQPKNDLDKRVPWEIDAVKYEKILIDALYDHVKEKYT